VFACNPHIIRKRARVGSECKPDVRAKEIAKEGSRPESRKILNEGCTKMIRKTTLQVGVAASFALILMEWIRGC
jgi:hypothetical protein